MELEKLQRRRDPCRLTKKSAYSSASLINCQLKTGKCFRIAQFRNHICNCRFLVVVLLILLKSLTITVPCLFHWSTHGIYHISAFENFTAWLMPSLRTIQRATKNQNSNNRKHITKATKVFCGAKKQKFFLKSTTKPKIFEAILDLRSKLIFWYLRTFVQK